MRITYGRITKFCKAIRRAKATITAQIQSLDAQLAQARNSYMKVEGAQEIIAIQIKEEDAKTTVEAVVPEASGD